MEFGSYTFTSNELPWILHQYQCHPCYLSDTSHPLAPIQQKIAKIEVLQVARLRISAQVLIQFGNAIHGHILRQIG